MRVWPCLLMEPPLSPVCLAKSFLFSKGFKQFGVWGWSQDHRMSSSVRIKFQPFGLPGVVRNVTCGFWIFPIKWKGICLGTAGLMTPKRSSSYLHAWGVSCQVLAWSLRMLSWSEVLFVSVPLLPASRHLTRCPLFLWLPVHYTSPLISGFLHPPPILISALQMVQKADVR